MREDAGYGVDEANEARAEVREYGDERAGRAGADRGPAAASRHPRAGRGRTEAARDVIGSRACGGPTRPHAPVESPMALSSDEVRKIARLARLAVSDDEVAGYAGELSSILDLVDQMNRVDTTGVEPMAHPQHATQRLRPDVVTEPNRRERYQAIAPAVERGLYLVPRVVE